MRLVKGTALLLACLFAVTLATPTWTLGERARLDDITSARLILRQQNTDVLAARTIDAANPFSPNYGKWLDIDEILDIVSPPASEVIPVLNWLKAHEGVSNIENRRDAIVFQATVQALQDLLSADLHYYTRQDSQRTIIRGEYSVPSQWSHIIDFVAGLTEFPTTSRSTRDSKNLVGNNVSAGYIYPDFLRQLYNVTEAVSLNGNSSLCLAEFQDDASFSQSDLTLFGTQTGEGTLKVSEIIGPYNGNQPDGESTLDVQYGAAIARGSNIWFWTVDKWMLEFSQDLFVRNPAPLVVSMSWGWPENSQCQIVSCTTITNEQYVARTNVEFNKITARGISLLAASGDQGAPGNNDPNCNSSNQPLSNIFPGGSPWVTAVGATMLTPTQSTSGTSSTSSTQTSSGTTQTSTQTSSGTSQTSTQTSSGTTQTSTQTSSGASQTSTQTSSGSSSSSTQTSSSGSTQSSSSSGSTQSSSSSGSTQSSTSSGATIRDVDAQPPICKQFNCATYPNSEVVCTYPDALITSGGGFSTYVTLPSWQSSVVNSYLSSGIALPPSSSYNATNRAFPDISANGHAYLIATSGKFGQVDGTSAATPVIGGLVALLNGYRLSVNKAPLGFLNPLLYQMYASNPSIFTDITIGNNKCTESCCDTVGWLATDGWDPVTGLGTPNFGLWLDFVKSLP